MQSVGKKSWTEDICLKIHNMKWCNEQEEQIYYSLRKT